MRTRVALPRVTDPQGVTRSEFVDILGRVVKKTDNLTTNHDGVVIVSPIAGFERTVEERAYEMNGARVRVIDGLGRTSVSQTDVFGRTTLAEVAGVRELTVYDDVANTVTTGRIAGDGTVFDAPVFSVTENDDRDRAVAVLVLARTAYGFRNRPAVGQRCWLGDLQSAADMTTTTEFTPDGKPASVTTAPSSERTRIPRPCRASKTLTIDKRFPRARPTKLRNHRARPRELAR